MRTHDKIKAYFFVLGFYLFFKWYHCIDLQQMKKILTVIKAVYRIL